MKLRRFVLLPIVLTGIVLLIALFYPYRQIIVLEEVRSEQHEVYYLPLREDRHFQINYIHSIHLSNVKEQYLITENEKLRFECMQYEDVAIGLPGYAEEGETLQVEDGVYTLTFENRVIDSFVLYVGRVNADLSLRYQQKDYHLKEFLQKGHSYEFYVAKVSNYELLKGARVDGN
ncbi:hypothetical protein SporoP37_13620 [Sporosarcina sp. P37]|uniref:DUF1850 domain-containing protein n=1 Tax=unclassified Sporosarcina TaxID=2647733 RepID=UPI000A17B97C|nr:MULTISPECIES: DUF1850 domain-containing protein [unclassified Sporosarcina]ARK25590.1 hypothetical protein SporoP37_13620 [Sporosarcina sp. P37]PID17306.1 DUF1850 domain-containing protein [Sporosarcina sp. P35]